MNCFRALLYATRSFNIMPSSSQRSTRRLYQISSHLVSNNSSTPSTTQSAQLLCSSSTGSSNAVESNKKIHENVPRSHSKRTENLPNETWTQQTLDLYSKLQDLVDSSNGSWKKHFPKKSTSGNRRFILSVDEKGKLFEYFMIYNKEQQILNGLCQYGPYTEGPNGHVHGGAIATILDVAVSALPQLCGYPVVTANLSVDFKKSIPLGSTVFVKSKITSIQGRKVFVDGELTSADELFTFATAKSLCVVISKEKEK